METAADNTLPFLGMNISKNGTTISTSVYRKPTNTELYLLYDSHVDQRYNIGLLKTMLYRAFRLSSTWKVFTDECEILKTTFAQLRYPTKLTDSTIKAFIHNQTIGNRFSVPKENSSEEPIMITIPFKGQRSADNTRNQLQSSSSKIGVRLQPVFTSRKIGVFLKPREQKPKIVSEQCVCTILNVVYVIWTMPDTPTDTYINVLLNTVP